MWHPVPDQTEEGGPSSSVPQMRMSGNVERFTFFWSGPFSQWHPSPFNTNRVQYGCAEQYMMAEKARLFGDKATLVKILAARSPRDQKRLGREVTGFSADRWNTVAKNVVYQGNVAKYTQNPDLRELLLATVGTTLVEASPRDTIWGIGLAEDDPRAQVRSQWLGKNWLGEVLTRVRDELLGD